ncbi:MAG: amidohydrolase family protein [Ferrovibrio sp.]|uniref:amidohydrolase family protein n=1 Tax=Ferrovibrio sp. TaxID=1917215 RepID=UPI00260DCE1B|nr:amidohydrolase family protein [Ferrovibrio sp.]MCW0233212.1 amidohydrolase family protein [Ferrovibrio sp.]
MLIRNAELGIAQPRIADLRIADGRIKAIAERLPAVPGELVIDAAGGALLPGLHDHHLHLYAAAAARDSLQCGPSLQRDADALQRALHARDAELAPGQWLRGVGYHESVAGDIDRDWLDRCGPPRPLRIQHRSGRLWLLNSAALAALGVRSDADDAPLERDAQGRFTGRLYDADDWLRSRYPRTRPSLQAISRRLAQYGVTGVTDTTPDNGPDMLDVFGDAIARGELLQDLLMMGDARLDAHAHAAGAVRCGAHKFHLHDADLPDFDELCAAIRRSHVAGRGAAFHCVTRTDLTFALGALAEAGVAPSDRIEHAGVTPPELLAWMRELGVAAVSQPGFIAERGDAYIADVAAEDRPWLYRLRAFVDAGVMLAGSTDAPFGDADPWQAMQAAVTRCTESGALLGADESLTPEQALQLFLQPADLSRRGARRVEVGAVADLCLLAQPWRALRSALHRVRPRLTLRRGVVIAG